MTTSDVSDAWTEGARVAMVMCGDKRDSSLKSLVTNDKVTLRRGRTAHFTVRLLTYSLDNPARRIHQIILACGVLAAVCNVMRQLLHLA